ncbi:MAG TPA: hypothetical protein VML75_25415 [Kofleriaceae bacterium]|nr:hypothetical protein [Kofleriaceae bacterium]
MWRCSFRGLTGDVALEVSEADSPVARLVAELFASWGPPVDPEPALRYRLQCDARQVIRGGEVVATVATELDLVPVFELDLYNQMIAHASGHWVLHGAGLVVDGRAIVLSGPSGAGKSTMTLGLIARGAQYLSDEYVAVGPDGVRGVTRALAFDQTPAAPVPPDFALVHYPLQTAAGLVDQPVHRPPPGARAVQPAPLGAVVLLRHAPAESPGLRPISGAQALERLWEQTMNRSDAALAVATATLGACPVRELVTRDVDGGCRALEELIR